MKYLLLPIFVLLLVLSSCGEPSKDDGVITYHGGLVMTNPVNVYLIWYGSWYQNYDTEKTINYFLNNIDSTDYYNIARHYYQMVGSEQIHVADKIKVVENYYVGSFRGTHLSKGDMPNIVIDTIVKYNLTPDPDGFYIVLTDQEVDVETICDSSCGWHQVTAINSSPIIYAVVVNTEKCPGACHKIEVYSGVPPANSPNNNWAADGMVDVIDHELFEALTDPYTDGWNGGVINHLRIEIGDKCTFNFEDAYVNSNLAVADITVGEKEFLIQKMWIQDDGNGGHCGMEP